VSDENAAKRPRNGGMPRASGGGRPWVDRCHLLSYETSVAGRLDGTAILAADDDADNLEILQYLIGQQGGVVRTARTAAEALELLLVWTPDILVFDISMPDMDGYQLLETIRGVARLRGVPAMAVTAHAYESDKARCLAAGFAAHVSKPYDPGALIELLAGFTPQGVSTSV
jgi:CheY-like chemotaxis protein